MGNEEGMVLNRDSLDSLDFLDCHVWLEIECAFNSFLKKKKAAGGGLQGISIAHLPREDERDIFCKPSHNDLSRFRTALRSED